MMNINLEKVNKVFFVGVGGIGISAIAKMMLLEGKSVLGSDISENNITKELEKEGAEIFLGQDINFIPKDTELIIYTIAVPKYDPVFFENLKNLNIPMLTYPESLGMITKEKYTIAVSGTHGKTTTTAMIAKVLIDAGKDPSVVVGSILKDQKSNLVVGKSEYFIVEACEYQRSFLNVHPKILAITNIEEDHLDYYKDLADIELAFSQMCEQAESYIICNTENPSVKRVLAKGYKAKVINYMDYFDKVSNLEAPGEHNRLNASIALAISDILGIEEEKAILFLQKFSGTERRLEIKLVREDGFILYDDYAHHPTEIKASLSALREKYPKEEKRIIVLFQPHLYSRTKAFFKDFTESFRDVDLALILPIYFAREQKDDSVSIEKLAQEIEQNGIKALFFNDFESAEDFMRGLSFGANDILVTMGAGEAYKVADKIFGL